MKPIHKGLVFNIKKYAIHDGPGIRTTVFLKGCPLRCLWCHNPESYAAHPELMFVAGRCSQCGACVFACPQNAIRTIDGLPFTDPDRCTLCGRCVESCPTHAREFTGQYLSVDEIVAAVEKDTIFYDSSDGGMTVSGGEPLAQSEFLIDLLRACRRRALHTAVDTSCYAPPEIVTAVASYADLFLCDLKHLDDRTHRKLTGVSNRIILENIRWLAEHHGNLIIRYPLIPGRNDDDTNVRATAQFAAGLKNLLRIDLLQYNPGGAEKSQRLIKPAAIIANQPLPPERIETITQVFNSYDIPVSIGG